MLPMKSINTDSVQKQALPKWIRHQLYHFLTRICC